MTSLRCPRDGARIELATNGMGRVVESCLACERRRAHRCIDCGQKLTGQARRCPTHRRLAGLRAVQKWARNHTTERRRYNRTYRRTHRDRYRAHWRAKYWMDPEAHRAKARARYYRAHPRKAA